MPDRLDELFRICAALGAVIFTGPAASEVVLTPTEAVKIAEQLLESAAAAEGKQALEEDKKRRARDRGELPPLVVTKIERA